MMRAIRLVTFDVNKTLMKVRGSPGEQYTKVAAQHGVQKSAAELDQVFTQVWESHWSRHPNFGAEDNSISARDWWGQVVQQVFLKCGYKGQYSLLNNIAMDSFDYFNNKEAWTVFPEVHDTLERLKRMDMKLGIISNFDKRLNTILENLDLKHYFDFVTTSEATRACKPNPRIFHEALRKSLFRFSFDECMHVGNSVKRDFDPAVKLGMKSVVVYRGDLGSLPEKFQGIEKELLLPDISTVPDLVAELAVG